MTGGAWTRGPMILAMAALVAHTGSPSVRATPSLEEIYEMVTELGRERDRDRVRILQAEGSAISMPILLAHRHDIPGSGRASTLQRDEPRLDIPILELRSGLTWDLPASIATSRRFARIRWRPTRRTGAALLVLGGRPYPSLSSVEGDPPGQMSLEVG